jgi:phage-related protein
MAMTDQRDKPLVWLGDSRNCVRSFPVAARQRGGFELREVQKGKDPSDWKPIARVGLGVREIRIHTGEEFRVMYVAKFSEAVYVLHAFQKRTEQTAKHDIEVAKTRFRALVAERRRERR